MEPIAIRVDYWTRADGSPSGVEPAGIEDFRTELHNAYATLVRGRPSDACGGGLYELVVHIATAITFRDVATVLLGGE